MPEPLRSEAGLPYRHQKVQRLRRLSSRRSARANERAFVAEGAHVLEEAIAAAAPIEAVFVAAEARDHPVVARAFERGARVHELAPGVLERVSDTVTPQPVLAIVGAVDVALESLAPAGDDAFFVVCVDVRDPGNAGTVLRSAEAAGASGVICCDGTVDLYNPKTVRASAGSIFHVPVVAGGNPVEVLDVLSGWGVRCLATVARKGAAPDDLDLSSGVAFVLGNEAGGLPPAIVEAADAAVTIPMVGRSESLNVGMAAAVLCFEAARQRRAR